MLSSLWDELGLTILAWERTPQLIEREELHEGLSALWADFITRFALTTCFPGLDALIMKHVSATRHVRKAIVSVAQTNRNSIINEFFTKIYLIF